MLNLPEVEYNQSLENVIKSFFEIQEKSFGRLAISEYYFPLFEEEFAKQNVPLEIKYLAVVESALNQKAVSKWNWGFGNLCIKRQTIQPKIDSYIDERSDPLKATAQQNTCRICMRFSAIGN
jgi:membrane-bound lytic murein transglycosylase D